MARESGKWDAMRLADENAASAELEKFGDSAYDAKAFAKAFYKAGSDAQAKAYCMRLVDAKATASQLLQKKVFRHYGSLIDSGAGLREMEGDLALLRRNLGKTEFLLASIENAAVRMSKLQGYEKKFERKKREEAAASAAAAAVDRRGDDGEESVAEMQQRGNAENDAENGLDLSRSGRKVRSEHLQLQASLEMSRFKKVQALLWNEEFHNKVILDAPNKLSLLLHYDAYDRAVDLILEVRKCNLGAKNEVSPSTFDEDGEDDSADEEEPLPAGPSLESYLIEDRDWAMQFAKKLVEEEANLLATDLISMLEKNQSSSSKHNGSTLPAGSQMRRRNSSIERGVKRNRTLSNHPVKLLQRMGMGDDACIAFLRGKKNALKELTDEIIYSPLATDPELCILELAQTVFGGILDTHLQFRNLFSTAQEVNGADSDDNASPELEIFPDSAHSYLLIWTKEQVAKFVTNFVRFLLPGSVAHDESLATDQAKSCAEWESVDDINVVSMKGIPFVSECSKTTSLVILSNDEWRTLGNCLRRTLLICRRLEKSGISLNFVLARQLKTPLNMALESIFAFVEKNLRTALTAEIWQTEQLRVESRESTDKSVLSLTQSGQKAYELVHDLIRKVKRIYSTNYSNITASLESYIISRTLSILEVYLENVVHAAGAWPAQLDGSREKFEEFVLSNGRRGESFQSVCSKIGRPLSYREKRTVSVLLSRGFSSSQLLGMISDALYISTDLVVRVRDNYEKLFQRRVAPLRDFEASFGRLESQKSPWRYLCDAFVSRQSLELLENVLHWSQFDYSSKSSKFASPDSPVSSNFDRLATVLGDLKSAALKQLGGHSCAEYMIASICEHILEKLEAEGMPSAIFGPVDGADNCTRLTSDLYMFLNLTKVLLNRDPSEQSNDAVSSILEKTGALKRS